MFVSFFNVFVKFEETFLVDLGVDFKPCNDRFGNENIFQFGKHIIND